MKAKTKKETPTVSKAEEKSKKIREMVAQGYQNREIAKILGLPVGTVGTYAAMHRKQMREKENIKESTERNADRHLCLYCKYRSDHPTVNGCDYADLTKKSRDCTVEDCTRYEKGKRIKRRSEEANEQVF